MICSLCAVILLRVCMSGSLHTAGFLIEPSDSAKLWGMADRQESGEEAAEEITAGGLEFEKRTDAGALGDAGRFRIRYSTGRGHKGAAIRSYDISQEGRIAIAFSDERIGVYDRDMNCLFELFFEASGAYGVLWKGGNVLFLDHRSNTAVEYNDSGEMLNVYRITGPSNHWFEIVDERVRRCGDDVYLCTNRYGSSNTSIRYGYYTILKRTGSGGEEIVYRADAKIDGDLWGALVIGVFFLTAGAALWLIARGRGKP